MTDKIRDLHLISTKLNQPRIAHALVSRPQLIEQLTAHADHPLILVSAPAGYGKTTLVVEWVASRSVPHAWLSLDEYDNELTIFLTYLTAAIRGLFPTSCANTAELLRAVALPTMPAVAATLINDLQRIEERFVMVLDDYHALRNPAIHELIEQLLRYPPTCLQLVIITRRDPPLPLSRYRAKGQMAEIRAQQLRFAQDEVALLVQTMLDRGTSSLFVEQLVLQTEGWIAGLRLAVLTLIQEEGEAAVQFDKFDTNRYAMEYLMSEVFAQQTPDMQDFLIKTSVLDRLSAPLCEAVTSGTNLVGAAQELLERAWRANLFIVSLDGQNEWFRYHQLLRQFLQNQARRQLSADEIRLLHGRAANWFATEAYLEEATRHFLHAGDETRAIRVLLDHRHTLMKEGHWSRLRRLLQLLPRHAIDSEPALLIQEAWLMRIQWQAAGVQAKVAAADTLLRTDSSTGLDDPTVRSLVGEVDTLRATLSLRAGAAGDAIMRLTRALDSIDHGHHYVRGYTELLLANALQMHGEADAALALLYHEVDMSAGNLQLQLRAWSALALIYYLEADMDGLWLAGTRFNKISDGHGEADGMRWGQYRLGVFHYLRNELDAAEQYFATCSDRPRAVHTMTTTNTAIGLALTYQAQGKPEPARAIAEANVTILEEMGHTALVPMAKAFRAELAARQGRMADAQRWIPQADSISLQQEYIGLYAPQLTLPKLLLLQPDQTSRQHAADYLSKLQPALEIRHNRRFMIETLALQGLLHELNGNQVDAIAAMEAAVALAGPGSIVRPFADIGPALKPLLLRVAKQTRYPDFIKKLSTIFESPITADVVPPGLNATTTALRHPADQLIESLTNRELDVLLLLADRMTNKEIAQALGISTETVKRHVSNLFQKLDVGNRRQAATKARAIGVLSHGGRTDTH